MVLAEPAAPRWPDVTAGHGHYESYYLRAVDPSGTRGIWIRYTVSVAPGGPPTGQLWFTLFDRSAAAPRAIRVETGLAFTGLGAWIRLGDSAFGPAGIGGRGEGASRDVGCGGGLLVAALPGRGAPAGAPPPRLDVPGPAPAHESAVRVPVGAVRRHARRRREVDLGGGMARHGRAQLGRAARRAVDLAARSRL